MSRDMRRFSITSFSLIPILLFLVSLGSGQINGVPASVTSIGFGGHFNSAPGVPASVTSLGPNGFGHGINFRACCFNTGFNHVRQNPPVFHHHFRGGYSAVYPYYTPAYTPVIVVEQPTADMSYADDEDAAGPTIFDRRGRRERIVAPAQESAAEPAPVALSQPVDVSDQPATVLIFKDGHRAEIRNYAIVGDTLYDFTSARHKIALAELDLPATAQENDDRGIDFHVPARQETTQQ
jgi:hypothetical protein